MSCTHESTSEPYLCSVWPALRGCRNQHSSHTATMACNGGGCAAAAVPSGSEAYAKLYPETSSDNVLRLGNVVPGVWGWSGSEKANERVSVPGCHRVSNPAVAVRNYRLHSVCWLGNTTYSVIQRPALYGLLTRSNHQHPYCKFELLCFQLLLLPLLSVHVLGACLKQTSLLTQR